MTSVSVSLADMSDRTNRAPARLWRLLAATVAAVLGAAPGFAQDVEYIPRDTYAKGLLQEGNAITFCYNADGMMADFEQDLAQLLGGVLLTETKLAPIPGTQITTPPLDHRLPLLPEQLYVIFAESCGAVIGYALSSSNPDWLTVTRPYMSSGTVMVATDPDYARLDDVPFDRPIASRAMSAADNRLINFLQDRPADRTWRRTPYFSNDLVLARVADGTSGAGLVWETALSFATDGAPAEAGYHVLEGLPFQAPPIEIGIATRSEDRYLNELLSGAIGALLADGSIERLMREHHLLPADAG